MSDGPKQYQIDIAIRYDIRSDWATVKEQVIHQGMRQWRAHRQEMRDIEDAKLGKSRPPDLREVQS